MDKDLAERLNVMAGYWIGYPTPKQMGDAIDAVVDRHMALPSGADGGGAPLQAALRHLANAWGGAINHRALHDAIDNVVDAFAQRQRVISALAGPATPAPPAPEPFPFIVEWRHTTVTPEKWIAQSAWAQHVDAMGEVLRLVHLTHVDARLRHKGEIIYHYGGAADAPREAKPRR